MAWVSNGAYVSGEQNHDTTASSWVNFFTGFAGRGKRHSAKECRLRLPFQSAADSLTLNSFSPQKTVVDKVRVYVVARDPPPVVEVDEKRTHRAGTVEGRELALRAA